MAPETSESRGQLMTTKLWSQTGLTQSADRNNGDSCRKNDGTAQQESSFAGDSHSESVEL